MAGVPVTLMAVGLVVSAIVGYITVKYFRAVPRVAFARRCSRITGSRSRR